MTDRPEMGDGEDIDTYDTYTQSLVPGDDFMIEKDHGESYTTI